MLVKHTCLNTYFMGVTSRLKSILSSCRGVKYYSRQMYIDSGKALIEVLDVALSDNEIDELTTCLIKLYAGALGWKAPKTERVWAV